MLVFMRVDTASVFQRQTLSLNLVVYDSEHLFRNLANNTVLLLGALNSFFLQNILLQTLLTNHLIFSFQKRSCILPCELFTQFKRIYKNGVININHIAFFTRKAIVSGSLSVIRIFMRYVSVSLLDCGYESKVHMLSGGSYM